MSTEIEEYTGDYSRYGMGDIEASDLVMPIINIAQKDGFGYVHSLTKEKTPTLKVVGLGVVKQRILWPPEPGETGKGPVCRSFDHKLGYPDTERFPTQMRRVPSVKGLTIASADRVLSGEPLSCAGCPAKEWGTHPRKENAPYCDEQWSIPLLLVDEDGLTSPALISFSRAAVKSTKAWISAFANRNRPMFANYTTLSLKVLTKGTNEYAVPVFTVGEDTERADWPTYARAYDSITEFITTPRFGRSDDGDGGETGDAPAPAPTGGNRNAARTPAAAPAPAAAAPARETVDATDDEDDATTDDTVAADAAVHAPPKRSTPAAAAPAPAPAADYDDEEPF